MSPGGLVDTHAHLMDAAFDADRPEVLQRATAADVRTLILVGYDLASSRAAVALARNLPSAGAAVAIHPNSAAEASDAHYATLAELARAPEVVAIGETGLDNYRDFTTPERQRQSFEWHLRLAEDLALPVIVHNRQADSDVLKLARTRRVSGVLHCFSSTDARYLYDMLELGYHVSFAGSLTFKNAANLREMALRVPQDRLLVETDCPYLAPEPHRGRRNEPAFVRDTAACLASVVGLGLDELTEIVRANTMAAFPALAREAVA